MDRYTKEWSYKMVLAKMLKKARDNEFLITYDENGYYHLIPEIRKGGNYVQHKVDLEEYRFNAWQELATKSGYKRKRVPLPNRDLNSWALNCAGMTPEKALEHFKKKNFTYRSLFCEFYHIIEKEIELWTYEEWRKYYDRVPGIELNSRFKFVYGVLPGTEHCHKEWLSSIVEKEKDEEREKLEKHNKKVWEGRIAHYKKL